MVIKEGNKRMSKDQKKALDEIKTALREVPEGFHAQVGKAVAHDIGVMARAIDIAAKSGKWGCYGTEERNPQ
mgnify:CR=1 FL=1